MQTQTIERAADTELKAVNDRLKKGEGWIGYRTGCRFLYFAFVPSTGAKQKFINTGSHDPEEAYRQLLAARQHTVKEGNRQLPQEVARLRYEDLMALLVEDYRQNSKSTLYPRKTADGGTEYTFGGKDDLDTFFKRKPITEITAIKIKEFIAYQRKQGYAGSTIRRQLNALRSAFTLAKKHDMITDNHVPSFVMPEESKPRKGFIDNDGFEKLKAALPEHIRPIVIFQYYTGCRSEAAEQITWGMVSSDCTEIHAPGSIIKNDEDWGIPLEGPLKPIADALKKLRKEIQPADKPIFDTTNIRKLWNQACFDLGLAEMWDKKTGRYIGLHRHDFRRSAARNLIQAGVSEQVAMKITGHKTTAIFRRYNIQNFADVKEALMKVGKKSKIRNIRTAGE